MRKTATAPDHADAMGLQHLFCACCRIGSPPPLRLVIDLGGREALLQANTYPSSQAIGSVASCPFASVEPGATVRGHDDSLPRPLSKWTDTSEPQQPAGLSLERVRGILRIAVLDGEQSPGPVGNPSHPRAVVLTSTSATGCLQ